MSEKDETKTSQITGTMDKDYDLFRYIETCLQTALRMDTYRQDAEQANDVALAALFTMTQNDSRKGAEIGKKLLASRLAVLAPSPADAGGALSGEQSSSGEKADKPPVDIMAPTRGDQR